MEGRVAIVGGGLGGFTTFVTLLHGGVRPDEIAVFDPDPDPVGAWLPRATAIHQQRMRSESDGHCFAASFPGLAPREAVRRRRIGPLLQTVANAYRPTLDEFVRHVRELRARSRWDDCVHRIRIERVQAVDGGFELGGHGTYRHVLLAPGHPGLAVPAELADDPRVVHAYAPHGYASRVTVFGAGMAAATEWLNALAAGAEVVSVRRREPQRRPLNVPRPMFSRRGLAAFHATAPTERVRLLTELGTPSYPPGRDWDEPIERARAEGRFRVESSPNGAEQIICATGFRAGVEHDRLLRRLVEEHELETQGRWLVLAPDASVPGVTDSTRTLAVAGAQGQWAYPAADTLMGMKYAARRFLRRVEACRTR